MTLRVPAAMDGSVERRSRLIARLVGVGLTLLLAAMVGRVVQLQVAPSEQLVAAASERTARVPTPGIRGDVRDRRGRPLAVSYFGRRAFADPALMPVDPEGLSDALLRLSQATGVAIDELARELAPRIEANVSRLEELGLNPVDPAVRRRLHEIEGLSRYLSVGDVLDAEREAMVRGMIDDDLASGRAPFVGLELRQVRQVVGAEQVGTILGLVGVNDYERPKGATGAELTFEPDLRPTHGQIRYAHDSGRRPLWIEPGGLEPPSRGGDVRLSIDLAVQQAAVEELTRGMEDADAAGGRVIILDPATGEVLAMADLYRAVPDAVPFDWEHAPTRTEEGDGRRYIVLRDDPLRKTHPSLGRNRCVEDVYEPGSTFKPFVWAAATERGLAVPDEVIETGPYWKVPYARRYIRDVTKRDELSWADVLVYSSNIGMAKVAERMTPAMMQEAVARFGFGKPTGVGLPGESPGIVTSARRWTRYSQTSVAMGHEVAVTPIQMVRAFSVFARRGERAGTLPGVRLRAAQYGEPEVAVRVLPAWVAELAREVMGGVTARLDERLARDHLIEHDPKYPMFGKSGTAEIPLGSPPEGKKMPRGTDGYFKDQYFSSFIAAAPTADPRIVVLVIIDDPGPQQVKDRHHYGSAVAGPVVRRIVDRVLPLLNVPAPAAPPETLVSASPDGAH